MFLVHAPAATPNRFHDPLIPPKEILHLIKNEPHEIVEQVNGLFTEQQQTITSEYIFNLGRYHGALEFKCKELEAERGGIWAFFQSLFNPRAIAERQSLVDSMQMSCLGIQEFVKAMPVLGNEGDEKSVRAPESHSIAAVDTVEVEPNPLDEVAAPQAPPEAPPAPPIAPPTAPPQPVGGNKLPGENNNAQGQASQANPLSKEEQHLAAEKRKLEGWLAGRANPNNFYFIQPPKNEVELTEKRDELTYDIAEIEESENKNKVDWLQKKKTALTRVQEQLKPQKKLLQYANQQQRAQFNEKAAKYTNEELSIIIGIAFEGKAPEVSHPAYSFYSLNLELLTKIFNNWTQLANGEKGKIFLTHAADWKWNVNINLFGFIWTLKKRMLPKTNSDHLPEPTYEPTPYGKKKELKLTSAASDKMPKSVVDELNERLKKK